jgi:RAB6A-GEF complex partner protein 2
MSTNIRVFVDWREPTVFAGESVECTVTFKNVARTLAPEKSPGRSLNGFVKPGERKTPVSRSSARALASNASYTANNEHSQSTKGHRPALSLYAPSQASVSTTQAVSPPPPLTNGAPPGPPRHGRSLSIMSMGSFPIGDVNSERGGTAQTRRPARGHGRSASLQVSPGRRFGSPTIGSSAMQ